MSVELVKVTEHVVPIYVNPFNGKFTTIDEGYVFEVATLEQMREKIDAQEKRLKAVTRPNMARRVFLCEETKCEAVILRGINANDSSFKVEVDGSKEKRSPGYKMVIVDRDHADAGTLLSLYEAYQKQEKAAEEARFAYWKLAKRAGVEARNGYGGRVDSAEVLQQETALAAKLEASLGAMAAK